jgi:hypothetical protein
MSHELQTRVEALEKMVVTRDLLIADLERENRELREMLYGKRDLTLDGKRYEEAAQ